MTRPDYATTKAGLISQVRELTTDLESMTKDRDQWIRVAQSLASFISNNWRGDRQATEEIIEDALQEARRG